MLALYRNDKKPQINQQTKKVWFCLTVSEVSAELIAFRLVGR